MGEVFERRLSPGNLLAGLRCLSRRGQNESESGVESLAKRSLYFAGHSCVKRRFLGRLLIEQIGHRSLVVGHCMACNFPPLSPVFLLCAMIGQAYSAATCAWLRRPGLQEPTSPWPPCHLSQPRLRRGGRLRPSPLASSDQGALLNSRHG